MKVGILTFHASHNYGSMLQAYALRRVLANFGVESEIINFRSDIQKSLTPPPVSARHPRSSLLTILNHPARTYSLIKKYWRFESFLKNELGVGLELHSAKEVEDYVGRSRYDAIISGSDQIWNPACWDFDMVYLLDFEYEGKRIAYAPSLGSHPEQISEECFAKMIPAIKKYQALSTREERGRRLLSSTASRQVAMVLDPTLLIDRSDYECLIERAPKIQQPYIFYYTPREEPGYFEIALNFAKRRGCSLLVSQHNKYYLNEDTIQMFDCGPKEFLSLINNATICIGNSFHLLAFSLIFNKEFYLLSNENDSRMLNILSPLHLENRLIINGEIQEAADAIDYVAVNRMMDALRSSSLKFLRQSLDLKFLE